MFRSSSRLTRFSASYSGTVPIGTGRVPQNRFTDHRDIAARRQVHDGVGTVMHRRMQFAQLFVHVRRQRRVPDIRVDLAQRFHPDRHRLQLRMIDVRRDDHRALRDLAPHQFGWNLLLLRDVGHLFRDKALARKVHLRHILVAGARGLGLALDDPLTAPRGHLVPVAISIHTHSQFPRRQKPASTLITG